MGHSSSKAAAASEAGEMEIFSLQDVLVFGFSTSVRAAKTAISGGHVTVDGGVVYDRMMPVATGAVVQYTDSDGRIHAPIVVRAPPAERPRSPPRPYVPPPVRQRPVTPPLPPAVILRRPQAHRPVPEPAKSRRQLRREAEARRQRDREERAAARNQAAHDAMIHMQNYAPRPGAAAAAREAALYRQQQGPSNMPEPLSQLRHTHLEFLLLDVRLEVVGLNRIDEVCEVIADPQSDESSRALPIPDSTLEALTWVCNEDGYIDVPSREPTGPDADLRISNEWFSGLRHHCDSEVRSLLRYTDMAHYRVFVLPYPAELCARVVMTTNQHTLTPALLLENGSVARVMAHYICMPDIGEWPATRPRVFRTTSGAAHYEARSGQITTPSSFTPRAQHKRSFADALAAAEQERQGLEGPGSAEAHATAATAAAAAATVTAAAAAAAASATAATPAPAATPAVSRGPLSVVIPTPEADAAADAAAAAAYDGTAAGFGTPRTPAGLVLYPHQRRTVAWMLAREALVTSPSSRTVAPPARDCFHFQSGLRINCDRHGFGDETRTRAKAPEQMELPAGGIIAHPVGAGKTVMTAALLGKTQGDGVTLVFIPDHLAEQWRGEVVRFVPTLGVAISRSARGMAESLEAGRIHCYLVPHSAVNNREYRDLLGSRTWHRVVFDEPQDLNSQEHSLFLVTSLNAHRRWLLTATPTPFTPILQLAWGLSAKAHDIEALRRVFVARCGIRDAPQDCLPVPPVHFRMMDVALTWQETSVVHVHTMAGHVQASIQLASYFANVNEDGSVREFMQGLSMAEDPATVRAAAAAAEGGTEFDSLDGWVERHKVSIETKIARLKPRIAFLGHQIEEKVAAARAARARRGEALAAADAARPKYTRDQLEVMVAERLSAMPRGPAVRVRVAVSREDLSISDAFAELTMHLPRAWEVQGDEQMDAVWAEFVADLWDAYRHRVVAVLDPQGEPVEDCLYAAELGTLLVVLLPSPRTDWLMRAERKFARQLAEVGLSDTRALGRDDAEMFDAASGIDPELLAERDAAEAELARQDGLLAFMKTVADHLADEESECAVCLETLRGLVVSILPCLHAFCSGCVIHMFSASNNALCPMCRAPAVRRSLCTFKCVTRAELPPPPSEDDAKAKAKAEAAARAAAAPFRGTKIASIIAQIGTITQDTADEKILVFAQWQGLLAQLSAALTEGGIEHAALTGSMEDRATTLARFRTEPSPRVLLLSYESHASGANLDVANHVIITHPYCPPSVMSANVIPLALAQAFERQAIGRVHRFPQRRPTYVYRYYARGTIEEDLYALWGLRDQ